MDRKLGNVWSTCDRVHANYTAFSLLLVFLGVVQFSLVKSKFSKPTEK